MKNYRHGEICLIGIKEMPKGLTETKSNVLMVGSHGHDHSFKKGKLYLKDVGTFIVGYFEAVKGTKLYHPEHGGCKVLKNGLKEASVDPGFYEIRKQQENTHTGMQPVVD